MLIWHLGVLDSWFFFYWPRRTMDSIRVSEAPDTGSIPVEATSPPEAFREGGLFLFVIASSYYG